MSERSKLALVFSDLHIHQYQRYNEDGQRLNNTLRVLDDVGQFCVQKEIDTVFFGGDLFDTPKFLATAVVNETVKAFQAFYKKYPQVKIYAISGNHDHATKNTLEAPAVSALDFVAAICPNFIIIDNQVVQVAPEVALVGIPYYEFKEYFYQAVANANQTVTELSSKGMTTQNYLLIHQTPAGMGNEMIKPDCFPADECFKPYDHVFCGHIHKHMKLSQNFTVVGNPIHRDAGDTGQKKGFVVINLYKPEKGAMFIPLKGYPEFKDSRSENIQQTDFVLPDKFSDAFILVQSDEVTEAKFATNLEAETILENYWKEVDGQNQDILAIGLECL